MSRTHRKFHHSRWNNNSNREAFVEDRMKIFYSGYQLVKRRRDPELVARLRAEAQAKYDEAVKENGGTPVLGTYTRHFWPGMTFERRIQKDYVRSYYYEWVPYSREEAEKDFSREFDKLSRDGAFSETSRRSGFKREAKKTVRLSNKRFCQKVLDGDWEEDPYPVRKEGKHLAWNWW